MRDISNKQISLRTAKAIAVVECKPETMERIKSGDLPKGDPFDIAKAAAFLGAKNTSSLLPHCHPVGIDAMNIEYKLKQADEQVDDVPSDVQTAIIIYGDAKSIGKTGIEMEILTGVSIAALTIYDLLKPIDKDVVVNNIKLLDKKGGKSDRLKYYSRANKVSLIRVSDAIIAGKKEDVVTDLAKDKLESFNAAVVDEQLVAQTEVALTEAILSSKATGASFVFVLGGTGVAKSDVAADVVREMSDKSLDGLVDAMRHYSLDRSGVAMVSDLAAGLVDETVVITIPGSSTGAEESLDALLPFVFHIKKMILG